MLLCFERGVFWVRRCGALLLSLSLSLTPPLGLLKVPAGFAPLRIGEVLLGKEFLVSGPEHEVSSAVFTGEGLVLKVRHFSECFRLVRWVKVSRNS